MCPLMVVNSGKSGLVKWVNILIRCQSFTHIFLMESRDIFLYNKYMIPHFSSMGMVCYIMWVELSGKLF